MALSLYFFLPSSNVNPLPMNLFPPHSHQSHTHTKYPSHQIDGPNKFYFESCKKKREIPQASEAQSRYECVM